MGGVDLFDLHGGYFSIGFGVALVKLKKYWCDFKLHLFIRLYWLDVLVLIAKGQSKLIKEETEDTVVVENPALSIKQNLGAGLSS